MSGFDGFLTETQREYLMGEHTPPNDNADQQMRYKIREQTKTALEDLDILAHGLPQEDMEQIVHDSKAEFEWEEWEKAQGIAEDRKSHLNNIQGVFTFLYLATLSDQRPILQMIMERAIMRAYKRRNQSITYEDIDVSISADPGPKAEEMDTDNLINLSNTEFWTAVKAGEITPSQILEKSKKIHENDDLDESMIDFFSRVVESDN